jgi:MoCo/4Fe-4S cofactor protein with predicted Tat translocation signal
MSQINHFWKSLEEYNAEYNAEDDAQDAYREFLHREFPREASIWEESLSRRHFIQIMSASLALAGLGSACSRMPMEKIVPYVDPPDSLVAGESRYFASIMPLGGFATGIIAETHEGRPTKIDGNPDHPASLGSSDPFIQASILSLYDPDRLKVVLQKNEISTWDTFLKTIQSEKIKWKKSQGNGVSILTEAITSPTLKQQINQFLNEFPRARWHQFNPINRENLYKATSLAFGERLAPIYQFEKAKIVLSLDGPFLDEGPERLSYARAFSNARRVRAAAHSMNRLYVIDCTPNLTGTIADHRLGVRPSELNALAFSVAHELGVPGISAVAASAEISTEKKRWIQAVVQDLKEHRGESLVLSGSRQSPELQALCFAMNSILGNMEKTVSFVEPVESQADSISELVQDMRSGNVDTLFILGGNPVYNSPVDLDFQGALGKVRNKIRHSEYPDETALLCDWSLPEAHFLETWGDGLTFDGSASIQQPVCAPFYEGRSAIELFALLSDFPGNTSHQIIHDFWKSELTSTAFESDWEKILRDGIIANTRQKTRIPKLKPFSLPSPAAGKNGLEILFKEDPCVYDGRFANNGWLQELPSPVSKITWGNAVLLASETAKEKGLESGDEVELTHQGRSVRGEVFILPAQPAGVVTAHLGYGRTQAGRVGNAQGFNAYSIQSSDSTYWASGVDIRKTGKQTPVVTTQHHFSMEGRNIVRLGTLAEFIKDPKNIAPLKEHQDGVADDYVYPDAAWAMSIDLNSCIGCNACMIACQAENNIPIVGKSEVLRGRSMHWIRVDRYYQGAPENPKAYFQPVPCMHCETAPCEEVCPTAATNHSSEGLNQMIYNRCVGTRFCSNNCPYKVRRFNFFQYSDMKSSLSKMMKNPDVTVRSRGVMEKCSYCVQRIRETEIKAELENREVRDGEIVTACQASCPTQAIVFGNKNDPNSQVALLKREPLDYLLLEELGTKPRTTYLAKLSNPNPSLHEGAV